jgi:hypothetical protein
MSKMEQCQNGTKKVVISYQHFGTSCRSHLSGDQNLKIFMLSIGTFRFDIAQLNIWPTQGVYVLCMNLNKPYTG